MANALHRTTLEVRTSINTPDYPPASWVINPDLTPVAGVPRKYWKLVGDVLAEMAQAEKDAVDAAAAALDAANLPNALRIDRIVPTPADLPLPPPRVGLFVGVVNAGAGTPGLAISTNTQWAVFQPDAMVGP